MGRYAAEERTRLMPPASPWLPPALRAFCGAPGERRGACFPPAGRGAGFFRDWAPALPHHHIVPVQLPGREKRFSETPPVDAHQAAEQVANALMAEGWQDIVLLGYSYGALLAFEVAHCLEQRGRMPRHLIACARTAPQTTPRPSGARLPNRELMAYVQGIGGLPEEMAANAPQYAEWADCSDGGCDQFAIDGGHFFIYERPALTFNHLTAALARSDQTEYKVSCSVA